MDFPTLLTEEQISKFTTEIGLSKEQIIEFYAEFKAYDTDGSGAITSINLGIVNKVKLLLQPYYPPIYLHLTFDILKFDEFDFLLV